MKENSSPVNRHVRLRPAFRNPGAPLIWRTAVADHQEWSVDVGNRLPVRKFVFPWRGARPVRGCEWVVNLP